MCIRDSCNIKSKNCKNARRCPAVCGYPGLCIAPVSYTHLDVYKRQLVDGEGCRITVAPKGFGSENRSRIQMLKPADGVEGFKKFVVDTVRLAGSNPCPPIVPVSYTHLDVYKRQT